MLRAQIQTESLVQLGDDARQGLQFVRGNLVASLGRLGIEHPSFAIESDFAAVRFLNPVRLHVDVLLNLSRQRIAVRRQQAPEVTRKLVKLLQLWIGKGQHLSEEGIEPILRRPGIEPVWNLFTTIRKR